MAPGTSHQTLMIRVYASLLQSAKDVPGDDGPGTRTGPSWATSGASASWVCRAPGARRRQGPPRSPGPLGGTEERRIRQLSELTSRVGAREIPEALKHLEVALPSRSADDVVLATNMISVGLDVDRLGLMA